jgi:uncharacterized membrane protein
MREQTSPVSLLAAVWVSNHAAEQAMRWLELGRKGGQSGVIDVVTLAVDAGGAARVNGTGAAAGGQGAVLGGILGAGLGVLTSGPGWVRLGGGMISALADRASEGGLPDGRLRAIGERLVPHASAIVAVVEHWQAAGMERDLAMLGAEVVTEPVSTPVAMRLRVAPAVVYCRGQVDGDVVATRTNVR